MASTGEVGKTTSEEFTRAVSMMAQLAKEKILTWRLKSGGWAEPRINEQFLEEKYPDKEKNAASLKILQTQIAPLLSLALMETPSSPFQRFLDLNEKEFKQRLEIVKRDLITDSLRARYLIIKTSKGHTFTDLRWDISIKRHDFSAGTFDGLCFATLEFVASPSSTSQYALLPFAFLPFPFPTTASLMFDCHLDDLNALIADLSVVRDNLQRLEQETRARGGEK